ncbi:MAG TPA: DUF1489 domain-containing protein [Parvibaculum sp.]|uniref:DUF1489 family protein n=1 Tax=Parvibaculum sp. TaxID=2024848 RepID=UPI002B5C46F4|nr:DUF1489 domain-containing protein [Parvibaculum sp.]HMM15366.1 DUF1489 domain-containing protein [Parvibaculum sp.]
MTLHLIKLCVGADDVEDLRSWQQERLAEKRRRKEPQVLAHVTRMVPTRADELLDGGSLYWVMKGFIRCRQRLLGIEPFVDGEGVKRCGLVLDPEIVLTRRRERRPFQGWRYLPAADAPADVKSSEGDETDEMPEAMRRELEELGLL